MALLRGDAHCRRVDFSEAFGKALAFGIDKRRGACVGDRIARPRRRNLARQRRPDHARFDRAVIGGPARMRVAIALDQSRAFGDLERELVVTFALLPGSEPASFRSVVCSCL